MHSLSRLAESSFPDSEIDMAAVAELALRDEPLEPRDRLLRHYAMSLLLFVLYSYHCT
jgi:hypothetical protein